MSLPVDVAKQTVRSPYTEQERLYLINGLESLVHRRDLKCFLCLWVSGDKEPQVVGKAREVVQITF